jgi:Sensors of blue-light using FAD
MVQGYPNVQFLYVSRLAPGADFTVVNEIARAARHHNPGHGITGALLFDGERFCQLIEGPRAAVDALMQRIHADPRHTGVLTLHSGELPGSRQSTRWVSGYCEAAELERFDRDPGLRGHAALDAFLSVLQGADVE